MSKNALLIVLLVIIGFVSISITVYQTVILGNFEAVDLAPAEEE